MCKLILIIIIAFLGISYGNAKTKMQSPPYESKVNGPLLELIFPVKTMTNGSKYNFVDAMNEIAADMRSIGTVGFEDLSRILALNEAIVIDVRNGMELLLEGQIPKTKNIPLQFIIRGDFELDSQIFEELHGFKKPRLIDDIVVLCKTGKRALRAAEILAQFGYIHVSVYPGGIQDWRKNGGWLITDG